MKRVLLVSCDGLGNGGIQSVIMNIVRNLHEKFIFDILLFTKEKRYYDDEFIKCGGQIYRIPKYGGKNRLIKKIDYYISGLYIYYHVKNIIKSNNYDVVHCHNDLDSLPIIIALLLNNVKVRIVHTHVMHNYKYFLDKIFNYIRLFLIYKFSSLMVACSEQSGKHEYGNKKFIIINNTFDNKKFYFNKYEKKSESFNMIQVGRFDSNKNQIFTIKVLYELIKKGLDVRLDLVGQNDNVYINKMHEIIHKYN